MQDIQSIGGGGGGSGGGVRLFGGVGDRRLRPHQNNQPLKCPRCDSLNTKFCYYNNYNLSQPRHFCKSCRRYWTKGGVLRNVPVGGGCRKTKRSKPKQPPATPSSPAEAVTTALQKEDVGHSLNNCNNNNDKSSHSHSNSESSSLTATNTTATANTTIEAVSSKATTPTDTTTTTNNNAMFSGRIEVETSKLFSTNPSLEQAIYDHYQDIGSLTGLIPTSSSENMGFGLGNMMSEQTTSVQVEQQQGLWEGGFDETVKKTMQNGGSRGVESGGELGNLDWEGSGDQGLFHIPNAMDQAYWNQNQWSGDQDNHPGLYLP